MAALRGLLKLSAVSAAAAFSHCCCLFDVTHIERRSTPICPSPPQRSAAAFLAAEPGFPLSRLAAGRRRVYNPNFRGVSSSGSGRPLHFAASDGDDSSQSSPLFAPQNAGAGNLPPNFNPFDRAPLSSERRVDSASLMSVRKLRMKSVMNDLLRSVNNDSAVDDILTENEEFLCEQLNDMDTVLDVDSIYSPEMGREERYHRYEEVMDERIGQARDRNVKKILERLKEFVLSYNERNSAL